MKAEASPATELKLSRLQRLASYSVRNCWRKWAGRTAMLPRISGSHLRAGAVERAVTTMQFTGKTTDEALQRCHQPLAPGANHPIQRQ